MAYKMRIPQEWIRKSPNTAKLDHIFNLDAAVGPHAPNRKDDVMLVQFMLGQWAAVRSQAEKVPITKPDGQALYDIFGNYLLTVQGPDKIVGWRTVNIPIPSITGSLASYLPKVDGVFSGVTQTWVMIYQMFRGPYLHMIDGRVDPTSSKAQPQRSSTINMLNLELMRLGVRDIANSDAPDTLKAALQAFRA